MYMCKYIIFLMQQAT